MLKANTYLLNFFIFFIFFFFFHSFLYVPLFHPISCLENLDKTVEGIDKNIDRYNKELSVIKKKIEEEKNKKPVNKHIIEALRKKAEIIIKRKKVYETNKENTLGIQFNVDQVKYANESLKTHIDTVKVLEASSKVLKKNIKKININKVERIQDNIFDYMDETKEITELLSASYEVPVDLDETEIDAELALIEDSILEDKIESVVTEENETNVEETTVKEIEKEPDIMETEITGKENVSFLKEPTIENKIEKEKLMTERNDNNEKIKDNASSVHMKIR